MFFDFKLPKDNTKLPPVITTKLTKLTPALNTQWYKMFDEANCNKILYEDLVEAIKASTIPSDQLNETITNKRSLEEIIGKQESTLLQFLNEPVDKTIIQKAEEKAMEVEGHGAITIRAGKGVYTASKQRQ